MAETVGDAKVEKTTLRSEMRVRRKALSDREARSRRAIRRLMKAEFWGAARTVLVSVSTGAELETGTLIQKILDDPMKTCVVPYCLPGGKLGLFRLENEEELVPGAFGIREPSEAWRKRRDRRVSPDSLDLVLLPAVAVDAHGFRLGQGGGYYDRLLETLAPSCRTVGLVFACQQVRRLPREAHDFPVDFVVTENTVRRTSSQVIGIIGGVASGKSLVSTFLEERGVAVFYADRVGHEALTDPTIRRKLVARWGKGILERGKISRPRVAEIVFAPENSEEQMFLNGVIHPWILSRWRQFRRENGCAKRLVLDAPLLLEAGWKNLCDEIIFVDTPLRRRRQFAALRGWSPEELDLREKRQISLREKSMAATVVFRNRGAVDVLQAQLEQWFSR